MEDCAGEPKVALKQVSGRRIDAASTLRMADHVVVLLPGGAVQGPPAELVKSADPRVSNLLSTDVDEALIDLDAHLESAIALSPDELESTWS